MTTDNKERTWSRALDLEELWEGDLVGVVVDGKPVMLINVDGTVYAYANRCPHQDWELSDGDLDDTTLTCVRHLWEFDITTGCGVNPADARLTGYPCRVDPDGAIYVDVTHSVKEGNP